MDRFSRSAFVKTSDDDDAASAAQSVCDDFRTLIEVFDRQLGQLPDGAQLERTHIQEARAAAERGLMLGRQLIGMLRTPESGVIAE